MSINFNPPLHETWYNDSREINFGIMYVEILWLVLIQCFTGQCFVKFFARFSWPRCQWTLNCVWSIEFSYILKIIYWLWHFSFPWQLNYHSRLVRVNRFVKYCKDETDYFVIFGIYNEHSNVTNLWSNAKMWIGPHSTWLVAFVGVAILGKLSCSLASCFGWRIMSNFLYHVSLLGWNAQKSNIFQLCPLYIQ